ncbi:helix-turn-helix domain-containing protein [Curtobacterium flaccumfaciens]|uniref:helix-turn-helix domain-containing protein n=1 Tax=Curtobacterium flaccumfaciens TaxID=2035 RepID=UPI001BDF3AB7|nr:helix-turn-helix domain-containing protein [Curtobacterium flaccumfaciens]MBT1674113.1 helix-turn-helix transcriptional regulator [Curtobacterium flaccumfaciens pv. flaccumfaciens]
MSAHVEFILAHPVGGTDAARVAASQYLEACAELVPQELRPDHGASQHPRAVRRAVTYIRANLRRPLAADEIAAAAGVSPRALQLVFQRSLGTSPLRYVRDARLAGAHAELLTDQTTPIGAVAGRWCFTNQGRFSAAYRERYGETPNETRQRVAEAHEPAAVDTVALPG